MQPELIYFSPFMNRLSGLFHKKIQSLWNRHLAPFINRLSGLLLTMMPENSVFVEQAGKPVADNDARCEVNPILFVMQDLRSIFD